LRRIAAGSLYSSSEEMLAANYTYLVETLVSELRGSSPMLKDIQSQAICFYSLQNIMHFLLNNIAKDADATSIESTILLIVDMQTSMIEWFNKRFHKNAQSLLQCIMAPIGLVKVFKSSIDYLNELLLAIGKVKRLRNCDDHMASHSDSFRWEDLLLEFKLDEDAKDHSDELESSKPRKPLGEESTEKENDFNSNTERTISAIVLSRLNDKLKRIIIVSSTISSLPNLKLRLLSCDLLESVFGLFSTIQYHIECSNKDDPTISALGNPLRESFSQHWPSLRIRLQKTSSSFILSSQSEKYGARKHLASLLASTFGVVRKLGQINGEMVASVFQEDIYPIMGKLLSHILPQVEYSIDKCAQSSDTNSTILSSILDCLKIMFSPGEGAIILANIMPSAGSMILPLLAKNSKIGETAMEIIKLFLAIDCDCLWRSLLSISGNALPKKPNIFRTTSLQTQIVCDAHEAQSEKPGSL